MPPILVQSIYGGDADLTIAAPAAGFTAGNLLCIGGLYDDATNVVSGISDTHSNSYFRAARLAASGKTVDLWYAYLANTIPVSDIITIALSGNDGGWFVAEFSGLDSNPLDQAPTGVADTNVGSHTTGSATTGQADELLVSLHGTIGAVTYTATGGFAQVRATQQFFGMSLFMQYQVVSSIGTYAGTCTTSGNASVNNLLATFKAAGAAPPATTPTVPGSGGAAGRGGLYGVA